MELDFLYKLDYNSLKDFLLSYKDITQIALKDKHIKEKLINPSNKYEFIWFVQDHSNDLLSSLLDDEGINILQNSDSFDDKMNGLLTSCNPNLPVLFKNKNFNELILRNMKQLKFYLSSLEPDSVINFVEYVYNNNDKATLEEISLHFNQQSTLELVKKVDLPYETKLKIIKRYKDASEYLLNNDLNISTLSIFSLSDLYNITNKDVHISKHLLEENEFIKKITTTPQIKEYRFIINALGQSNDISEIELKRKKYYEQQLHNYIPEEKMLKNYYDCYNYISLIPEKQSNYYQDIKFALKTYLGIDSSTEEHLIMSNKIFEILNSEDENALKSFFQNESNIQLSNIIIDYHFEEISYNLFLNLKQLLNFQKAEGKTLSNEEIDLYNKVLNVDSLSYEEKLSLHRNLKNTNFIEKYYDDFRIAKNKASELIKENILTDITVQKYKDEELSKQTGVNIYVLDKDPFYALVKSLGKTKEMPLDKNDIYYTVDGASYSLDGSNKLNTFENPKTSYNVAYKDFEINQVIHVYPTDSFSKYDKRLKLKPTDRVYELHTPQSLTEEYKSYNEILIAQKNDRKHDELNENLKVPEMFAIYCYDVITENDIISAKNLGIGIILVKTKAYEEKINTNRKSMYDTTFLTNGYKEGIKYLDDFTQDDKFNRRK